MPDTTPIRLGSWVRSEAEVADRQQAARELVGAQVEVVRYVNIDYRDDARDGSAAGPRTITDSAEWSEPTWLFPTCHSLDYGLELDIRDAEGVALTWQTPGWHEGLVLSRGLLVDQVMRADANTAVWDVTSWGPWLQVLAAPMTDVQLRYVPWGDAEDDGYWCPLVTVTFRSLPVHLLLAEGQDDSHEVQPSADNVAVLFPEHRLPDWALPHTR